MKYNVNFFMTTPNSADGGTGTLAYNGGGSANINFMVSGGRGSAKANGSTTAGIFTGSGDGVEIRISKNQFESKDSVAGHFSWNGYIYNFVGGAEVG